MKLFSRQIGDDLTPAVSMIPRKIRQAGPPTLFAVFLFIATFEAGAPTAWAVAIYDGGEFDNIVVAHDNFEIHSGHFMHGFRASNVSGLVFDGVFDPFDPISGAFFLDGGVSGVDVVGIAGGTFNGSVQANAGILPGQIVMNISGGSFLSEIQANGAGSNIHVDGGNFHDIVFANGSGAKIYISGGKIFGGIGTALGTVIIAGSHFALDGVPVGYGPVGSGLLTGTLLNGDHINAQIINYQGSVLTVAEPSSSCLAIVAFVVLSLNRSTRIGWLPLARTRVAH